MGYGYAHHHHHTFFGLFGFCPHPKLVAGDNARATCIFKNLVFGIVLELLVNLCIWSGIIIKIIWYLVLGFFYKIQNKKLASSYLKFRQKLKFVLHAQLYTCSLTFL